MANNSDKNIPKPDFRKAETANLQKGKFPIQMVEEYRVQINEDAYTMMKDHAATTVKVELCGILVGNAYKDEKGIFLKIDAVIEGRDASSQGAQVTFTHQTWNHINDVMDKKFPNKQIVGWYHTHPGFGVFLSGMDLFIQENFFNQPFQIAIVIETHAHEEGCFIWVDGASTPLKRYWVGEKEIKLAGHKPSEVEVESSNGQNKQINTDQSITAREYLNSQNNKPTSLAAVLFPVVLLFLGFFMGQFFGLYSFKKLSMEAIESELYSIQEYAATNALAKEDLQRVREEITLLNTDKINPEEKLKKTDELIENIKKLEIRYSENRSSYRKKVQELSNNKSSLSARVNENMFQLRNIEDLISELYIVRLNDLLKSLKKDSNNKISDGDLKELERSVHQILTISPEKKQLLLMMYPEMMEAFYPTKNKNNQAETDKKEPKSQN